MYRGPAITLVHRFKFQGELAAGSVLGRLMVSALAEKPRPDVLVPVPLAAKRLRQRGFDQGLELTRLLSRSFGMPVVHRTVRRHRDSVPQSTLSSWAQRRKNVRNVFHVEPRGVSGFRVALVDDVMTSGATVNALSAALLSAGAREVHIWVACRAGIEA
jgi:ComF family protein